MNDHLLDNPVWNSLSQTHKRFAIDHDTVKFYQPDYCPFGGFIGQEDIADLIRKYADLTSNFFIVGDKPAIPDNLIIKNELVCLQMIIADKIQIKQSNNIVRLTGQHRKALYELVNLVQPGYFKKNTFLLGDYFGIFDGKELIAITGERMKMNDFTEVSAVITHPSYTGMGYAKQLVAHEVNHTLQQKKMPFLHVAETNIPAITLYEGLGFKRSRKISFWNISQ
jgi:GNAT superfamily N-acetyltransferase